MPKRRGNKPAASQEKLSRLDTPNNEPPIFDFSRVVKGYSVSDLEGTKQLEFIQRLEKLSTMTWMQIMQADRSKAGQEKIAVKSINAPMPAKSPEKDFVIALRYCPEGLPMVGERKDRVFSIFWVEKSFNDVYQHDGKNFR